MQSRIACAIFSLFAWAAQATDTVKPWQDLQLVEGYYSVTNRQDENCVPGEFKWYLDNKSSTLVLGPKLFFAIFNKDNTLEISPYAEDCKFKIQSSSDRKGNLGTLNVEEEQTCNWGYYKARHKVTVEGSRVTYHQDRESNSPERVAPLVIDCNFVRMVPQPKINPPPFRQPNNEPEKPAKKK